MGDRSTSILQVIVLPQFFRIFVGQYYHFYIHMVCALDNILWMLYCQLWLGQVQVAFVELPIQQLLKASKGISEQRHSLPVEMNHSYQQKANLSSIHFLET